VTAPAQASPPSVARGSVVDSPSPAASGSQPEASSSEAARHEAESSQAASSTANNQDKSKEFYTIKTKSDKVFYMIIDEKGGEDNVYLLTEVNENDLLNFVQVDETSSASSYSQFLDGLTGKKESESSSEAASMELSSAETSSEPAKSGTNNSSGLLITLLILIFGGAGVYYYFKIYLPKKKLDDADNLEDYDYSEDDEKDDTEEDND
jgi:hypothetical protein